MESGNLCESEPVHGPAQADVGIRLDAGYFDFVQPREKSMNKQNNVTVDADMAEKMGLSRDEYAMILQQLGRNFNRCAVLVTRHRHLDRPAAG